VHIACVHSECPSLSMALVELLSMLHRHWPCGRLCTCQRSQRLRHTPSIMLMCRYFTRKSCVSGLPLVGLPTFAHCRAARDGMVAVTSNAASPPMEGAPHPPKRRPHRLCTCQLGCKAGLPQAHAGSGMRQNMRQTMRQSSAKACAKAFAKTGMRQNKLRSKPYQAARTSSASRPSRRARQSAPAASHSRRMPRTRAVPTTATCSASRARPSGPQQGMQHHGQQL